MQVDTYAKMARSFAQEDLKKADFPKKGAYKYRCNADLLTKEETEVR